MAAYIVPFAAWHLLIDNEDLTGVINPRLISVTLTEKRDGEADQVDIVLDDADGLMKLPRRGVILKLSMGWKRGTGLPVGLVDKGEFKVDEVSWSGEPDRITIRARSADLTSAFRVRKERSFIGKTVGQIVTQIATDNGYTPHIAADLSAKVIPALGSGPKSDSVLLKELGKRFDAVATIKAKKLIFARIATGKTASGAILEAETLMRQDIQAPTYSATDRETYGGIEATWHNKGSSQRQTIIIDASEGNAPKRLKKIYANETDARHAAEAEATRMQRAGTKFEGSMAFGRPDLFPDKPINLMGYKDEIRAHKWYIAEISHTMDGQGGLTSRLSLEAGE